MGERGHEAVAQHYQRSREAELLLGLFKRILSQTDGRQRN